MTLRLTCACWSYDRTVALQTGEISPKDIRLEYTALPPEQTFLRQLRDKEFDVSEMSLSAYIAARAKGEDDFLALPIFPSRIFRHSAIYVNPRAGIKNPQNLRGKRVGVGFYQMTAAVWARGLLKDEYGIGDKDIEWITGPGRSPASVTASAVDQLQDLVAGTRQAVPPLELMLENGEIDGLITVHIPHAVANGSGRIKRLFENHGAVERDYFRRTHIFPIMHTLVVRRSIYDLHPWIATSLIEAFTAAKRCADSRLYDTNALAAMLPSLISAIEDTRALMGNNYWPYGVKDNESVLKTFIGYLYDQGIIQKPITLDGLFVE
jgi:4,5-dihydroxyphthalate decarboxylase